jgi:hypothetical protein
MPHFSLLPEAIAVARLSPREPVPAWALESQSFASVTRTADELSVVCPESLVPRGAIAERGWRALMLHGPLPFSAVGVLEGFASPLARAGISIFAVSTFDTDFVLVKSEQVGRAIAALVEAGHTLVEA